MPGRFFNSGDNRYGFNGKENDNEVKTSGNSLDFGARMYDPRLGKFLSIDPKASQYPYFSPYGYALDNPIYLVDDNGEGPLPPSFVLWAIKEGVLVKAAIHNVYSFEIGLNVQAMVKRGLTYQIALGGIVADHKGNIGFYFSPDKRRVSEKINKTKNNSWA